MSSTYVDGGIAEETITKTAKERIRYARAYRRQFEPVWHSNLAFVAGRHWLEWDRFSRTLRLPDELADKELYTADVITEYREHVLGELNGDDDQQQLLLVQEGEHGEQYQEQLNRALGFGWRHEFNADQALREARRLCVDLGTSAIRCRFDPTVGPVAGEMPNLNGEPLRDKPTAYDEVSAAVEAGQTLGFKPVREGRITWDPLSVFNLLTPPGMPHEDWFPWECVVRPALLSKVIEEYGDLAADMKADTDIGSLLGFETDTAYGAPSVPGGGGSSSGKLRDHVWLFTYYEKPTALHPNGQTLTLGGNKMRLLRIEESLPYIAPDETPRSGISYFHWWRVTGQFHSRALIENMKDIQRGVNKRRTQLHEIIDRSMPFMIVQKDSLATKMKGRPVEMVEIGADEREPKAVQGAGPGAWVQADVDAMREDLEHATGIRGPRLGENPPNVDTYGQLALLNEQDVVKRSEIYKEHHAAIGRLIEDSVYDMRRYWGREKQLKIAGPENRIQAEVFNAEKIPDFYIVRRAPGPPKPRSQAAELKKIEDIWNAAVVSTAVQAAPHEWVTWLKESQEAGQPLDLPDAGGDSQQEKAELENYRLLTGEPVMPSYFDPPGVHIPTHRRAQIEAEMSRDMESWQLIEDHVQAHLLVFEQNQQAIPQPAAPIEGEPSGQGQEAEAGPPVG